MRRKLNLEDLGVIAYYTGFVTLISSALMVVPIIVAVILSEWSVALDLILSLGLSSTFALIAMKVGQQAKLLVRIQWKHGLVISATVWVSLMLLFALPYYLSGHYLSYLDATFDVMSGFTTTGLTLSQDLDHMAISLNLWRHILTFVGGQGMVVLALSFLFKQTHGAYKIYVGEAKDVELVPSVKGTARIIWMISLTYMLLGTLVFFIDGIWVTGLCPKNALFQGFNLFASAWSTGGFATHSQNTLFYHSFSSEMISILFMILGSFNFGLHFAIWKGSWKEIYKNIETQAFFVTIILSMTLLITALSREHLYLNAIGMFRKGVYHLLSAHTTTGFGTLYARQFLLDWGDLGIIILIIVMLIGGSACSTAGGIKGLRVGITFRALVLDVKKLLYSERRIVSIKYHHIKDMKLDDALVRSSTLIVVCYFILFSIGTMLGCFYGYSLTESAFEAASVTGNVGLSIGITSALMPTGLKVFYIIAMYLGRLEFLSVFALIGFVLNGVKTMWGAR